MVDYVDILIFKAFYNLQLKSLLEVFVKYHMQGERARTDLI